MHPGTLDIWIAQVASPTSSSVRAPIWPIVTAIVSLVLIAVAALFLWRRRRRTITTSSESTCGHCGYVVTGLPTFVCPECGSDLREVGIVRAGRVPGARSHLPWGKVIAWTIACAIIFVLLGMTSLDPQKFDAVGKSAEYGFVDAYLWPYAGQHHDSVGMTPASGAYRRLTVRDERAGQFWGWRNTPHIGRRIGIDPASLSRYSVYFQILDASGRLGNLTVESQKKLAWSWNDSTGGSRSGSGPIDSATFLAWLSACGADAKSVQTRAEADELFDILRRITDPATAEGAWTPWRLASAANTDADGATRTTPAFGAIQGSGGNTFTTVARIEWFSVPIFGLLWLLGIRRIVRKDARSDSAVIPGGSAETAVFDRNAIPSPSTGGQSRTLTVLFTDLKDYTARAEAGSRQSLLVLLEQNRRVVETAVKARGGRMVKPIGDAFLVAFESATNALLAGLDIQEAAAEHNATAANAGRLDLHIGVSTGEVVEMDGDVFGTAVNVAARLQGLAEAGEVLFTESTWHAMHAAEVPHEEVGSRDLKGIAMPVRVYRAGRRVTPAMGVTSA